MSINTFVQIDHLKVNVVIFQSWKSAHVQAGMSHCFHVNQSFIESSCDQMQTFQHFLTSQSLTSYRVSKYRLPFLFPLLFNDVFEYFFKINLVLILTHETITWKHLEVNQYSGIWYCFTFIKLPFLKRTFSANSNFVIFAWFNSFPIFCSQKRY